MASKSKVKGPDNFVEVLLHGGPKDGETLRMDRRIMPPRIRFGFPEWCNYKKVSDSLYEFYDEPWEPIAIFSY